MSKGIGQKIAIKFTQDLVGDVSGSKDAFTVTGKEYQYVNGPLVDKEYQVDKVERYPVQRVWELGELLELEKQQVGYTNDLVPTMTSNTQPSGVVAYNYQYNSDGNGAFRIFDDDLSTRWATDTETAAWISYEFGIKQIVHKYSIMAHSTSPKTAPRNWTFEALKDGQYITLDERNSVTWTNGEKKEFIINNTEEYKEYRLNITADNGGGWLSITEMELKGGIYEYNLSTEYITDTVQLAGEYRIRWLENEPTDTNIIIEYTTGQTQGQWQVVSNGDIITSDTNLWFRVTLETTDTSITPTLQDLWIEEPEAPDDQIRLVMHPQGRFNNVDGDLTVDYDASKGNLQGRGGAVESFSYAFTPTDLEPKPNPHAAEIIAITPYADIAFTRVHYRQRYVSEKITATANATVVFTYVGTINP